MKRRIEGVGVSQAGPLGAVGGPPAPVGRAAGGPAQEDAIVVQVPERFVNSGVGAGQQCSVTNNGRVCIYGRAYRR